MFKFPNLTKKLRALGLKLNVYMPNLPLKTRLELLSESELIPPPSRPLSSNSIRRARDLQEPLPWKFEGNVRPIRIPRIREDRSNLWPKTRLVSTVWPGDRYSFQDEEQYLQEYRSSHYAFSPKKGGWDTMRSIEILFSDCIPIIPNIGRSPDLALFGYPKTFLAEIWKFAQDGALPVPDNYDRQWLNDWAQRHLTSQAQAKFLLDESGYRPDDRGGVHLLDLGGMRAPNYVSMGILVGLLRNVGTKNLTSNRIPDYLTKPAPPYPNGLYGRGFGYAGELSNLRDLESTTISLERSLERDVVAAATSNANLLIMTNAESLDANPEFRLTLVKELSSTARNLAIVHSGDLPLSSSEIDNLAGFGTLFLREVPDS